MNISQLAADYHELREKLAQTVPERERLFLSYANKGSAEGCFGLRDFKALCDYNRTVLFVLTKFARDDIKFRRLVGDKMFSKDELAKLLAVESPHANILRRYEEFFRMMVHGINPMLKDIRRLIYNQSKIKNQKYDLEKQEDMIRGQCEWLAKFLAPYQVIGTFVHQEAPGTTADQEVNNPQRFVNDPNKSLWVLVKIISEMEIYLNAVASVAATEKQPQAHPGLPTFIDKCASSHDLADAVGDFPPSHNGVLASAGEVAEFRQWATQTQNDFLSRTACLYFVENDCAYVAFSDSENPDHNILLSRSKEVVSAAAAKTAWYIHDKQIQWMIARAKKDNRCIRLPSSGSISAADVADDAMVIAMLGRQGAKAYQQFLQRHRLGRTNVYFLDRCSPTGVDVRWLGVDSTSLGADGRGSHVVGVLKKTIGQEE